MGGFPTPRPVFYTQHSGRLPTQFSRNSALWVLLHTRKTHPMYTHLATLLASVKNPFVNHGGSEMRFGARHFPSRFSVLGAIFPGVSNFLAAARQPKEPSREAGSAQNETKARGHHGSVQGKTKIFEGERRRRRRGESSVGDQGGPSRTPLPLCPIRETSRTQKKKTTTTKSASIPFLFSF